MSNDTHQEVSAEREPMSVDQAIASLRAAHVEYVALSAKMKARDFWDEKSTQKQKELQAWWEGDLREGAERLRNQIMPAAQVLVDELGPGWSQANALLSKYRTDGRWRNVVPEEVANVAAFWLRQVVDCFPPAPSSAHGQGKVAGGIIARLKGLLGG